MGRCLRALNARTERAKQSPYIAYGNSICPVRGSIWPLDKRGLDMRRPNRRVVVEDYERLKIMKRPPWVMHVISTKAATQSEAAARRNLPGYISDTLSTAPRSVRSSASTLQNI